MNIKAINYSQQEIEYFTQHVLHHKQAFNWLLEHNKHELLATLEAIRDDKKAFQFLINGQFFVLAAFVNAIWDDANAFQFLIKTKAYDWAACANIVNGDDKAEVALKTAHKNHFVQLAKAIQSRIHEDGDRLTTPVGIFKSMFNFKKKFD